MTTPARAPRRAAAAPEEPPADSLAGIACCEGCGGVLFEDLLGRLQCLEADCDRQGMVVGQADVDVGVLTLQMLVPPEQDP